MKMLQVGRGGLAVTVLRWLGVGAVAAVPLAALFALLDFPDWTTTLSSFLLIFAFALPLGLVFRALLHGLHWHVYRTTSPARRPPRAELVEYSTTVIAVGAACTGAYVVLAVGSGLATGDWSP